MKADVVAGLKKAAGILPAGRAGAAYLRVLWLKSEKEALTVMATDGQIEFVGRYAATSLHDNAVAVGGQSPVTDSDSSALVGVQGKIFVGLVLQLPGGQLALSADDQNGPLHLEQGRRKYKLPTKDSTWFQSFAEFPEKGAVSWAADFLLELIERVDFCISGEDASDALGCLYMKSTGNGRIECCGLNGHQFALTAFLHDDLAALLPDTGILIQKKYLKELKTWLGGLLDIAVSVSEKRLYLRSDDGREMFSLPLSTYTYPDYTIFLSRLSADSVSRLEVDRKEFVEALNRLPYSHYAFRCPKCGHVQSFASVARHVSQEQALSLAHYSCEGRFTKDCGCDWTLGGLFQIHFGKKDACRAYGV